MSFVEILRNYSSHHMHLGTDKDTTHSYGPIYDTLFAPYRDTPVRLLEIGIYSGAALRAYADYFANGQVYGLDITDHLLPSVRTDSRLQIAFGNALDPKVVNQFGTTYDIIIEDASHLPNHQIQHMRDFTQLLNPGGIYIMEDLHEAHFNHVRDETARIAAEKGLTQEVIDIRSNKGRFDDILLVFRK